MTAAMTRPPSDLATLQHHRDLALAALNELERAWCAKGRRAQTALTEAERETASADARRTDDEAALEAMELEQARVAYRRAERALHEGREAQRKQEEHEPCPTNGSHP